MKMTYFITTIIFLHMLNACSKDEESNDLPEEQEEFTPVDLPDVTGYPMVGTGQSTFYGATRSISEAEAGADFYGQNAHFPGTAPNYTDNGDETITDNITGLMWAKSSDLDGDGKITYSDKLSQQEAADFAADFGLNGYDDWRLPSIKELYSLILFSGVDPSGYEGSSSDALIPFINREYFDFAYGDTDAGERLIDAQFATTTMYTSTTMNGARTMFGLNLADGRIKGYPTDAMPGQQEDKQYYVLYVRGNTSYGQNNFIDNGDGTITDQATGLMWMQDDLGVGINWQEALNSADTATYAGYSDWRLPDVKELHSIVDYTRSPEATSSAAINPLFQCTQITNEAGEPDFAGYWSSTTHANWSSDHGGANAAYIAFGRAMGYMNAWIDVHGAGAQRSDPKAGDPANYPAGLGPQGDAIRVYNQVRLVRSMNR